jgi:hypothetical protein
MEKSGGETQARLSDDVTEVQLQDRRYSGAPVECLGMTFEDDDARRAYFLQRLERSFLIQSSER